MSVQIIANSPRNVLNPTSANAFCLAWMRAQPQPQIVVTPDLKVQWINDAAASLLSREKDVLLRDGHLFVRDDLRTSGLAAFLKRDEPTASAWVFKRQGVEGYFALRCDHVVCVEAPLAYALTFVATADNNRYVWSDIKAVFGLTRCETNLIKRMLAGKPIQGAAEDMGVSIDTARTHIRNVYGKLGISSREQLFAMILPFRIG